MSNTQGWINILGICSLIITISLILAPQPVSAASVDEVFKIIGVELSGHVKDLIGSTTYRYPRISKIIPGSIAAGTPSRFKVGNYIWKVNGSRIRNIDQLRKIVDSGEYQKFTVSIGEVIEEVNKYGGKTTSHRPDPVIITIIEEPTQRTISIIHDT